MTISKEQKKEVLYELLTELNLINRRYNKGQLADRLGISRRTLECRLQEGLIPSPADCDGKWSESQVLQMLGMNI